MPPLHRLLADPEAFLWATGIEDTFITDPWPATGRILDEYALTDHYARNLEDIDRVASLGVPVARYGIPWYRVNPGPGRWDWAWADQSVEHMLARGVDPILDLVHYGVPAWIEGAWLNPDLPERMAEYSARVAERYRGRIHAYTPLNEPRITAWYCGRIGWWPPYARGWRGFVSVMLGVCRGICMSAQALRSVDPEVTLVHVDATDLYDTDDPSLQADAELRQHIGFLALDLVGGWVHEEHPLAAWLSRRGASDDDLSWFRSHAAPLDVVGLNMYPMFSNKRLVRTSAGLRMRSPVGGQDLVERLLALYWAHFERPLMITETAARGSVRTRLAWLEDSLAGVASSRAAGIPVVGYTWWPMFSLVAWAWRQGTAPVEQHLQRMGLWDLDARLERVETPLVGEYRRRVAQGARTLGPVKKGDSRVSELLHGRV